MCADQSINIPIPLQFTLIMFSAVYSNFLFLFLLTFFFYFHLILFLTLFLIFLVFCPFLSFFYISGWLVPFKEQSQILYRMVSIFPDSRAPQYRYQLNNPSLLYTLTYCTLYSIGHQSYQQLHQTKQSKE